MNEIEKLEQQLLYSRAIGMGLCAVLTSLFVAHVKVHSGDTEVAISAARKVLDDSLLSLKTKGTTHEGEKVDTSPDMHRRLTRLLNEVEISARRMLGRASGTAKSQ